MQSQLVQHKSGLWVLAAPDAAEVSRLEANMNPTYVGRLISILRSQHRFVVFDAPPLVGSVSSYLFSRCTFVIVVTYLLDLSAIRDTGALMESLNGSQMPSERIKLVVNRYSQSNPFSIADLEQTVKHEIDAHIPEDGATVSAAINEGIPVVLKAPGSSVAKAIKNLCDSVVAELPK